MYINIKKTLKNTEQFGGGGWRAVNYSQILTFCCGGLEPNAPEKRGMTVSNI